MDPRAARTLDALHATILELAATRPISDIPVTEIVAHAGVNRSSLYQHFTDREELLASALETIESISTRIDGPVRITDPAQPPAEIRRFVEHFAAYAPVYRLALGPQGSARVASRVRARMIELVREGLELSAIDSTKDVPRAIEAAGIAGGLLGIVEAWIRQDPMADTETAAAWLWGFLTSS